MPVVPIRLRRDTAANWTAAAPVLLSGEVGFETDTGKFKIGDGVTVWASLGYYPIKADLDTLTGIVSGKQDALGYTAENAANKDTDVSLSANSDTKYASQKAVKAYIDAGLATKQASLGFTPENAANKSNDATMAANSSTLYPTQAAVRSYVAANAPAPVLDTDGTLAANSDTVIASQKAVKTYVDTGLATKQATIGYTAENAANKDVDATLAANSDTKYASQKAVKSYVDTGLATKQASLGYTAENAANKDIDSALTANSDTRYPSQKAIKSYVDTGLAAKQASLGFTPEDVANKSTDGTMASNSDTLYPSQKAVRTYVLANAGTGPATGVSVTPSGNLSSTNVQNALVELQGDVDTLGTSKQQVFNGLEDATKFAVAYNSGTRIFTVTYSSGAAYYVNGVRYTKAAGSESSTAHAATTGLWFLYFDSAGALTVSSTAWDLLTTAQLAAVYYTTSNNGGAAAGILINEFHPGGSSSMSSADHRYNHLTRGTQVISGCTITAGSYTLATNSLAAITPAFASGTLADEDLTVTTAAVVDGGPYRVAWKTGAAASPSWNWSDSFTVPFYNDGTQINYNQNNAGTYQMTAITTNLWTNIWVLATTSYSSPQIIFVHGENTYASLALAQAATFSTDVKEISRLTTEGVVLYRLTYRRAGGGATWFNSQLADVAQVTASIITTASGAITAGAIPTDTGAFGGILSAANSTVQSALDTIDDHTHSINTLLPTQTGNAGKFLTTSGTAASWANVGTVGQVIDFADAEDGTNTGWTEGTVSISSGWPTGTVTNGGAQLLSPTSFNPHFGTYTYAALKNAAAGSIFYRTVTVPAGLCSSVLTVEFSYSFSAYANYADGDLGVAVYAVNGSTVGWIQPAPFKLLNINGIGKFVGEFQTTSDATTYLIGIVQLTAGAANWAAFKWDNWKVYRGAKTLGTAVTDFGARAWTPTGTWVTNTTYTGKWRQVGDVMEGYVNIALSGAPNNTALSVNLPSGMTVDAAKLVGTALPVVGRANGSRGGGGYDFPVIASSTALTVLSNVVAGSNANAETQLSTTVPATWANGDSINIEFRVPIVGFSSGTVISSESDTRIVAAVYSTPTSLSLSGSAYNPIIYGTKVQDTHGAYNTSTGAFTAPVPGFYRFSAGVSFTTTVPVGMYYMQLATTSTGNDYRIASDYNSSANINWGLAGTGIIYLNAGQTAYINIYPAGGACTLQSVQTQLAIERISGPVQVAASEKAGLFANATAQSIPNITETTITTWAAVKDTHGALSGGVWTAPRSGWVTAFASVAAASNWGGGYANIYVNATAIANLTGNSVTAASYFAGGVNYYVNAGDTIRVKIYQNTGGAVSVATQSNLTYFTVLMN